jgi:hypothetical protein
VGQSLWMRSTYLVRTTGPTRHTSAEIEKKILVSSHTLLHSAPNTGLIEQDLLCLRVIGGVGQQRESPGSSDSG